MPHGHLKRNWIQDSKINTKLDVALTGRIECFSSPSIGWCPTLASFCWPSIRWKHSLFHLMSNIFRIVLSHTMCVQRCSFSVMLEVLPPASQFQRNSPVSPAMASGESPPRPDANLRPGYFCSTWMLSPVTTWSTSFIIHQNLAPSPAGSFDDPVAFCLPGHPIKRNRTNRSWFGEHSKHLFTAIVLQQVQTHHVPS